MGNITMKHFDKTKHLKIDVEPWINLIKNNPDNFFCPFSNTDSYLHIYTDRQCDVQFFNLQHCDYAQSANRSGEVYIKYLMQVERKLGNANACEFLKDNFNKFTVETNEENFVQSHEDDNVRSLIRKLDNLWHWDASTSAGHISRARIVKLPANGEMPYHRDETDSKNLRVICPLITHEDVVNGFIDDDGEHLYHMPSSGHFYTFEEVKYQHAVFNKSNIDRYALIFTVNDVDNMREWDKGYKRNEMFWKAYSRGI
jgi:hypothetical protein